MDIQSPKDWYSVTAEQLHHVGVSSVLKNYYNSSLITALQTIYPEHSWLPWRFRSPQVGYRTSKKQNLLVHYVKKVSKRVYHVTTEILPMYIIEVNFVYKDSKQYGRPLEFDVFVPELSLALEYNGEYHYHSGYPCCRKRKIAFCAQELER